MQRLNQIMAEDESLLEATAFALRFVTRDLAARIAGDTSSLGSSHRRLERLSQAGYFRTRSIFARKIPAITSPLFHWEPGTAPPDTGHISYVARKRFGTSTTTRCQIFIPTRRTFERFAVARRSILKTTQTSHDFGVAEMFLYVRAHHPEWVNRWRGEDCYAALRGIGEKVEDAVILKPNSNEPERALEFLGASYDKERLQSLHEDLARRSLPYLWF